MPKQPQPGMTRALRVAASHGEGGRFGSVLRTGSPLRSGRLACAFRRRHEPHRPEQPMLISAFRASAPAARRLLASPR